MPMRNSGVLMLLAGAGVVMATAAAPLAAADTCDPSVTICQGDDVQSGPTASDSPAMPTSADQYPFDDDWYFNPAGGGTNLQPNHPSGGEGGGGGGGHH